MDQFITQWIDEVREGDSTAAEKIWEQYYHRLVSMARQRLQGATLAVSDEEDVAISVFESFYRAAENGRFPDLNSRDDLWKLLLRMSARKIVDRHRYANRARRQADLVSLHQGDDDTAMIDVIGKEPSPELVATMAESCEQLLGHLDDDGLRSIAIGKMEGYSNAELAEKYDCSERTIERRLSLIRRKFTEHMG